MEYVLDYVLERKRVDDMAGSIKSRRYDRQKFNMNMCGLRHLVYLVEGNPDTLGNESGMRHTPSVSNTTHPLTDCMPMPTSCCTSPMLSCISWRKACTFMTCHAIGTAHCVYLASPSRAVML